MKTIAITPKKMPGNQIAVSARVIETRPQVTLGLSAALCEKIEPGERVGVSVNEEGLVLDFDPEDDAATFAVTREFGKSFAVALSRNALPRFGSHHWVDPVIRGKKVFLPLDSGSVARWMAEKESGGNGSAKGKKGKKNGEEERAQ